jgi:hypothetical protein
MQRSRDLARGELLDVHDALSECGVPAAELGGIRGNHPTVVEERGLPAPGPLGQEHLARVGIPEFGRRVLVEERSELAAECLVVRAPAEVHDH